MVNHRDIIAAHILVEMANGVSHGMVRTQRKSSDTVLADCDQQNGKKCGNSELKIRFRLSEANCSEIKRIKKKHNKDLYEQDQDNGLGDRLKSLTGKPISVKKKIRSQKTIAGTGSLGGWEEYDHSESTSMAVPELLTKSAKMQQCSHCGFSFSIIHLLSAVRSALITGHMKQTNLPSLTIQQILEQVRSKPGDPNILVTKEALVDLIRECLKRLSSKTAPLGADGWKPLTSFKKTSKSWSWIGPVPVNLPLEDDNEVKISSKSWGIPRKTLVKLVNCFSDWLKKSLETLLQIKRLPPPPAILMQPINMMERFKEIRPLKSFCTINPSSLQLRDYFRREEALRYQIPARAFSYTALDGRKSMVAPLVKSSGKPSTKAREHYMLKDNRPPSFTVLCLVRDAAARLPGRIGTRADVCVLVRDSQYIAEEVSEVQLTTVVSGALDRLHYEGDPCVRFDRERHLWAYLHGDREDEDFEHEATTSRKRKRRTKEMLQVDMT